MRNTLLVVLLSSAALAATGENAIDQNTIVVSVAFADSYSPSTVKEMQREVQGTLKRTGLKLVWENLRKADDSSTDYTVLVRFQGACGWGALGVIETPKGYVLRASMIDCAQERHNIIASVLPEAGADLDHTLGRALGRALAHELDRAREGVKETAAAR